jgi:hypothetical protein
MALTTEQQAQVDIQTSTEDNRATHQAAADAKRAKLEMVRTAKEILVENRRTQAAAEATDITAGAITAMAAELATYVNS